MQIQNLINILASQKSKKQLSDNQIGISVDILIHYEYFNSLANTYGRQYLVKLVKFQLLQPYILRKNRYLLDTTSTYVLIKGSVEQHGFSNGQQISVDRDGQIKAEQDSIFIKISLRNHKSKKIKKLHQFQSQKVNKLSSISMKILHDQQKQQVKQKLESVEIFNNLSQADFKILVYRSEIVSLFKNKSTHDFDEIIENLFFILEGEVKLSIPFLIQQEEKKPYDEVLDGLMIKKRKHTKNQISSIYAKGQWIGLEQHFQKVERFKSFGEVLSVQAKLLVIPVQTFDFLFNATNNHSSFNKLQYLTKIKADLIQKSSKAQQQKQNQMIRWSNQHSPVSPQLRTKVSKYQLDSYEQLSNNPQKSRSKIINKSQTLQRNQSLIPIKVVHIFKTKQTQQKKTQQKQSASIQFGIRKIKQTKRVNLFPQEYEKQFVRPNEQKQIQIAQQKKNTNMMNYLSPKHHRKECLHVKQMYGEYNDRSKEKFDRHKFEKSYVSLNKKITENYVLSSTFYRQYLNKGDQLCNLNSKTIDSLQKSRQTLLLNRKKSNEKSKQSLQKSQINLPGIMRFKNISKNSTQMYEHLNNRMNKKFTPMNPNKSSNTSLYAHFLKQKYNIQSNNSLIQNLLYTKNNRAGNNVQQDKKQNYSTMFVDKNYTSNNQSCISQIGYQNYSKTLFVNKKRQEQIKEMNKLFFDQQRKSSFKKKYSLLSIQ